MKTVCVKASKNYDVVIGSGLLKKLGSYVADLSKAEKVAIISDSNVWRIYGAAAEGSLRDAGFSVYNYVFPAGEESKNGQTYLDILGFLAQNHITRTDLIIALGGGVTGDITGFAAASYLRGVKYIQVPTSLLAMVDSSVGGKTAIDLPTGKNLAGAFYQPCLVLCDIDALDTLPADIFVDGCAEVIKYAILFDHELFSHLSERGLAFDREAVVSKCVQWKRDVVAEDEFDTGARQRLNLGHTIGHGIEANSCYTISHGRAVAIGIAVVTKAAYCAGLCSLETLTQVTQVLSQFKLPIACPYSAEQLYTSALSDKKRSGGNVNLIVPNAIGSCQIRPTAISELETFVKAGL